MFDHRDHVVVSEFLCPGIDGVEAVQAEHRRAQADVVEVHQALFGFSRVGDDVGRLELIEGLGHVCPGLGLVLDARLLEDRDVVGNTDGVLAAGDSPDLALDCVGIFGHLRPGGRIDLPGEIEQLAGVSLDVKFRACRGLEDIGPGARVQCGLHLVLIGRRLLRCHVERDARVGRLERRHDLGHRILPLRMQHPQIERDGPVRGGGRRRRWCGRGWLGCRRLSSRRGRRCWRGRRRTRAAGRK